MNHLEWHCALTWCRLSLLLFILLFSFFFFYIFDYLLTAMIIYFVIIAIEYHWRIFQISTSKSETFLFLLLLWKILRTYGNFLELPKSQCLIFTYPISNYTPTPVCLEWSNISSMYTKSGNKKWRLTNNENIQRLTRKRATLRNWHEKRQHSHNKNLKKCKINIRLINLCTRSAVIGFACLGIY